MTAPRTSKLDAWQHLVALLEKGTPEDIKAARIAVTEAQGGALLDEAMEPFSVLLTFDLVDGSTEVRRVPLPGYYEIPHPSDDWFPDMPDGRTWHFPAENRKPVLIGEQ